ncbi:GNAT family N-acetyltransferase [Lichenifustis flavocetrariae]|uniref:GNAT family N-acetyltransferase n=1 Tax=Lichenifustis flavocetrariae TaxID=2949735 RepID=A0AA41YWR5_9HYPH|nr:GNAT family N-acetyltransferase [Lichenifustis flavocetrariae]MCW6509534.1 GNAT family N-acetyltransferase [Lichenifustis flavocetrariae]
MLHDFSIKGARFGLRPVTRADARYILGLRSNPLLNRYIGPTSGKLDDQIAWQERYEARSGDWYFMVTDGLTERPVGTIAIYDYDPNTDAAEWGRWILAQDTPAAVESVFLMFKVAFDVIGLTSLYSLTNLANQAVVSFHDSCGVPRARILHDWTTATGELVDAVEHRVTHPIWIKIAPRLEMLSRRLAGAPHERG